MAVLTRSILGLLARRKSTLAGPFVEGAQLFDVDEWESPGILSIVSGELRLSVTGAAGNQWARFLDTSNLLKALVQVTGRSITTGGSWGPVAQVTDVTHAAADGVLVSAPHGFSSSYSIHETVAGANTLLVSDGPRNYANGSNITQVLAIDGGSVAARVYTSPLTIIGARSVLPSGAAGRTGFRASSGTNNSFGISDFMVCRERNVVFYHDVPDGYLARVHGALDVVVATGVFADGIARVDMFGIEITGAHERVTITPADASSIIHSSEQMYIWPGDVFGDPPPTFGDYFYSDPFDILNVQAPEIPVISINSITRRSAVLAGSAFVDPDLGIHTGSQWQVQETGGDWSAPIVDTGEDAINLLLYATGNVLEIETGYEARVRYTDDDGAWSPYSIPASFTTLPEWTYPTDPVEIPWTEEDETLANWSSCPTPPITDWSENE